MKDLAENIKLIYRNDRRLIVMAIALWLVGIILILLPVFNLSPSTPKIWARYSDITRGYAESSWWYLLTFSALGVILTVGHSLIAVRLYEKKGVSVAMAFLVLSIAVILLAIAYLLKILWGA